MGTSGLIEITPRCPALRLPFCSCVGEDHSQVPLRMRLRGKRLVWHRRGRFVLVDIALRPRTYFPACLPRQQPGNNKLARISASLGNFLATTGGFSLLGPMLISATQAVQSKKAQRQPRACRESHESETMRHKAIGAETKITKTGST